METEASLNIVLRARDEASAVMKSVEGALSGVRSALGGLGLAAVGAFVTSLQSADHYIETIQNVAKQTGLTTEASSHLVAGFAGAGLSADQAESMISRLEIRLGRAQDQMSKATQAANAHATAHKGVASSAALSHNALAELGLAVTDTHGKMKPMTELMPQIIDKLNGIEDPSKRAQVALRALGLRGKELNQLLELGGAGFRQSMKDADLFGLVVGEKTAKSVFLLHQQMARLHEALLGFQLILADYARPVLEAFNNTLINVSLALHSIPEPIQQVIVKALGFAAVFGSLLGGVSAFTGVMGKLLPVMGPFGESLNGIVQSLGHFIAPLGVVIAMFLYLRDLYEKNAEAHRILLPLVQAVVGLFQALGQAFQRLLDPADKTQKGISGLASSFNDLIVKGLELVVPLINQWVIPAIEDLTGIISNMGDWLPEIGGDIVKFLADVFTDWVVPAVQDAAGIFEDFLSVVSPIISEVMSKIGELVDVIRSDFAQGWDPIYILVHAFMTLTGQIHDQYDAVVPYIGILDALQSAFGGLSSKMGWFVQNKDVLLAVLAGLGVAVGGKAGAAVAVGAGIAAIGAHGTHSTGPDKTTNTDHPGQGGNDSVGGAGKKAGLTWVQAFTMAAGVALGVAMPLILQSIPNIMGNAANPIGSFFSRKFLEAWSTHTEKNAAQALGKALSSLGPAEGEKVGASFWSHFNNKSVLAQLKPEGVGGGVLPAGLVNAGKRTMFGPVNEEVSVVGGAERSGGLKGMFTGAKDALTDIPGLLGKMKGGIGELIGMAPMLLNPWVLLGVAVAGLIAFMVVLFTQTKNGMQFINEIVHTVVDAFKMLWNVLSGSLMSAFNQIKDAIDQAFGDKGGSGEGVKKFMGILTVVGEVVISLLGGALKGFVAMLVVVIPAAIQIVVDVIKILIAIIATIVTIVSGVIKIITALIHGDFKGAWDAAVEMVKGVAKQIGNIWNALWDGVLNLFKGFALGIAAFIWGFVTGAIDIFKHLYDQIIGHSIIPDLINGIVQWFASLPGRAASALGGFIGAVVGAISGVAGAVWNVISGVLDQVNRLAGSVFTAAISIGTNILNGIKQGISGALSSLHDVLQTVGGSLPGPIKQILGISSPSRIFADEVGGPIMHGIAQGIAANAGKVHAAMTGAMDPLRRGDYSVGAPAVNNQQAQGRDIHVHVEVGGREVSRWIIKDLGEHARLQGHSFGSNS